MAELAHERRRADAKVDLAKRARLADEELVPLMRERLDAWHEWGEALGEADPPSAFGRGRTIPDSDSSEPNDRMRARKLAFDVPADAWDAYRQHDKPDELTIAGALRLIPRTPGGGDAAAFPPGKFRVLYADPPWQYNDSGKINESDGYGRAERHYRTLSLDELRTWYIFTTDWKAWRVHIDVLAQLEVNLRLRRISDTSIGFLFPAAALEQCGCEVRGHGL